MQSIKDIIIAQKFGILCGSLFISLLFSCKNSSNYEFPSFEISTSGCYKTCPILDVKLYDNVVYYDFIKFNKSKGTYQYKLTIDDIDKLNYLIKSLALDSLKEEYASHTPDVQVYNTKFTYRGEEKNVYFFENEAPKNYQDLINYIISFKENKIVKMDTILNITTRERVPFEEMQIPPMPKDSIN